MKGRSEGLRKKWEGQEDTHNGKVESGGGGGRMTHQECGKRGENNNTKKFIFENDTTE